MREFVCVTYSIFDEVSIQSTSAAENAITHQSEVSYLIADPASRIV